MDNESYFEYRLEALLAALQTEYHGDVGTLIKNAETIYNFISGR